MVVTVGGQTETVTLGGSAPQMTGQMPGGSLQSSSLPQAPGSGAGIQSPLPETITVTEGGQMETVTMYPSVGAQPGETMVVTVGGQTETVTLGGSAPQMTGQMPGGSLQPPGSLPQASDSGAGMQSPLPETITVTEGGQIETVTMYPSVGAQPGETMVVTVGGQTETVTLGGSAPQMTGQMPGGSLQPPGSLPQASDSGAGMQSPLPETTTVTEGGQIETVTVYPSTGAQPGETMVVTVGGQTETITLGGSAPQMTGQMPDGSLQPPGTHPQVSGSGAGMQSPLPETITVTEGGQIETVTVYPSTGAQPGETMVVTVGGQTETITLGGSAPQMTGQMPGGSLQPPGTLPQISGSGAGMQSPLPETITVTESGQVETVTVYPSMGAQPGESMVVTVGGQTETITLGGSAPQMTGQMPGGSLQPPGSLPQASDSGAGMQSPLPETITVTESGQVETVTVYPSMGAQPGETMVVTVGGQTETITLGGSAPQMTGQMPSGSLQPPGSLPQASGSGAEMQSPLPETITVTESGQIETVTVYPSTGAQPGETMVVTVGGETRTITIGSPRTCKYTLLPVPNHMY
jgi:hypothetical protein